MIKFIVYFVIYLIIIAPLCFYIEINSFWLKLEFYILILFASATLSKLVDKIFEFFSYKEYLRQIEYLRQKEFK